jgi:hypothetical protein
MTFRTEKDLHRVPQEGPSRENPLAASRRSFLKTGALAASSAAVSPLLAESERVVLPVPRLIYNNDGNDRPETPASAESFLAKRTTALASSEVDLITYATGIFHKYHHRSELTDSFDFAGPTGGAKHGQSFQWVRDLHRQDTDPLQLVARFARKENIACWWSMRMNDTHDSRAHIDRPQARNPWKEKNPHLLVRPEPGPLKHGWFLARSWNWSAVDYNHEEVRDLVVEIMNDVLTNYEVDGVELDFTRHPIFFREQTDGTPITDQQRGLMTEMMQRIQARLRDHQRRRGKRIQIGVHVPDSVDYCFALGLDLEEWMRLGIPDLVIAGGDFQLQPWEHIVGACRRYRIPVVASFSALSITFDPAVWRQEALWAWEAGVDGVATFNFFHPDHPLFRELHDPELLRKLPRKDRYRLSPLNQKMIGSLTTLLKDGESYLHGEIREKWINLPPNL